MEKLLVSVRKNFCKRPAMPFPSPHLSRLARLFETGSRTGKEWTAVVRWLSHQEAHPQTRVYFQSLQQKLKVELPAKVLEIEKAAYPHSLWKLWIEILMQADRGPQAMAELFKTFSQTSAGVLKLERQQQALLFVPRFQAAMGLAVAFIFTVILPVLVPEFFPTFFQLQEPELFFCGLAPMVVGFILVLYLCELPRRKLQPLLANGFFLYFISLQLDAGVDLATAWKKALGAVELSPAIKTVFDQTHLEFEGMDTFLENLQIEMKEPWPEILSGLLWVKASGLQVSTYLRETSRSEMERLMHDWEDQIRKLTMLTLLPLAGLILLPTLFLMIGPQMLMMMR